MSNYTYRNITKANGFDLASPENARQNNYAWAMAEFQGYVYVGTARNTFYLGLDSFGIVPPKVYSPRPEDVDHLAEIWRIPVSGKGDWEQVFKAPQDSTIIGIRSFIVYRDKNGAEALYGACHALGDEALLAVTEDGTGWQLISAGIPPKYGSRAMAVFEGKLYVGAADASNIGDQETYLFASDDPRSGIWEQIDFTGTGVTGEIASLIFWNGQLYMGTAPAGGFSLWRSGDPAGKAWTLVVDKGAGDELNEVPASLAVHEGCLYVGTAIWLSTKSVDPEKKFVPIKGFDLVRVTAEDEWKVIVGREALMPTEPETGERNLGRYPSGFGNIFNAYCWQLRSFNGELFVTSWDSSMAYLQVIKSFLEPGAHWNEQGAATLKVFLKSYARWLLPAAQGRFHILRWIMAFLGSLRHLLRGFGADFFRSSDGARFCIISRSGLGNPFNDGIRTLLPVGDKLFLGTANAHEGCEVWVGVQED